MLGKEKKRPIKELKRLRREKEKPNKPSQEEALVPASAMPTRKRAGSVSLMQTFASVMTASILVSTHTKKPSQRFLRSQKIILLPINIGKTIMVFIENLTTEAVFGQMSTLRTVKTTKVTCSCGPRIQVSKQSAVCILFTCQAVKLQVERPTTCQM